MHQFWLLLVVVAAVWRIGLLHRCLLFLCSCAIPPVSVKKIFVTLFAQPRLFWLGVSALSPVRVVVGYVLVGFVSAGLGQFCEVFQPRRC